MIAIVYVLCTIVMVAAAYRAARRERHLHSWQVMSSQFERPNVTRVKTQDSASLERFAFGQTVTVLRCRTCGDVGTRTVTGDAHATPDLS